MTQHTYEILQLVEMTITHRLRAADAQAANAEATRRTARTCLSIGRGRSNLTFGDIRVDFVPAVDPPREDVRPNWSLDVRNSLDG